MYHPLYYQALRCSGKSVYLYHKNGRVYHGTVISVVPQGVYIIQHPPRTALTSFEKLQLQPDAAVNESEKEEDFNLVYSPGSYFAFGALAGLSLGALAGGYWW